MNDEGSTKSTTRVQARDKSSRVPISSKFGLASNCLEREERTIATTDAHEIFVTSLLGGPKFTFVVGFKRRLKKIIDDFW